MMTYVKIGTVLFDEAAKIIEGSEGLTDIISKNRFGEYTIVVDDTSDKNNIVKYEVKCTLEVFPREEFPEYYL